jgi:hypothetical protein
MGVGGQCHSPATLPQERNPVPIELGGLQGWSGHVQKILCTLGFNPQTVQPIAIDYTNHAIPPYTLHGLPGKNLYVLKLNENKFLHSFLETIF